LEQLSIQNILACNTTLSDKVAANQLFSVFFGANTVLLEFNNYKYFPENVCFEEYCVLIV
jgi:hypothetical protein